MESRGQRPRALMTLYLHHSNRVVQPGSRESPAARRKQARRRAPLFPLGSTQPRFLTRIRRAAPGHAMNQGNTCAAFGRQTVNLQAYRLPQQRTTAMVRAALQPSRVSDHRTEGRASHRLMPRCHSKRLRALPFRSMKATSLAQAAARDEGQPLFRSLLGETFCPI